MPDSNPRYEKIPRKESIDKFVEGMKNPQKNIKI